MKFGNSKPFCILRKWIDRR